MTIPIPAPPSSKEILESATGHVPARQILRGTQRHLHALNFESLSEVPLGNGRRADVMAIGPVGEIWIVEIKSSIADFRADNKWPEYAEYCDAFYFAAAPAFPHEILPTSHGLMIADNFGGEIIRRPPEQKLSAARRKAVTLAFARIAAARLLGLIDPGTFEEQLA